MDTLPSLDTILARHLQDIKAGHDGKLRAAIEALFLGIVGKDEPPAKKTIRSLTDGRLVYPPGVNPCGPKVRNELKATLRQRIKEACQ